MVAPILAAIAAILGAVAWIIFGIGGLSFINFLSDSTINLLVGGLVVGGTLTLILLFKK